MKRFVSDRHVPTASEINSSRISETHGGRPAGIRLLIVNGTRRKVGGTEDYLASIIPELHRCGLRLAFISESDSQTDRVPIQLPLGVPEWCVAHSGEAPALEAARNWKPDLIYAHGQLKVGFENQLLELAPAVYFAHNYYGTCISGYKAHKWPIPRPCNKVFGWRCLVNYFPRRCGGRSPITMFRRYFNEKKRLENLKIYRAIVTHSEHMRLEYLQHGLPSERVFNFAYEAGASKPQLPSLAGLVNIAENAIESVHTQTKPYRLLFLGRMEKLKGGQILIGAAPMVQSLLNAPIQVTFGGDGPEHGHWQQLARKTADQCPGTSFIFPGWLDKEQVSSHLQNTDVMVVPSLWPEPFGRVGIQAGRQGIPVAAFAVGGIPEWLKDGVNGWLAPGDPPTKEGLANAIVACAEGSATPGFRRAAREVAARFSTEAHVERLMAVFESSLKS